MKSFATKTTGKWILAGEHAVLRGSPALVFPLESRVLEFNFEPKKTSSVSQNLELEFAGGHGEELQLLFWGVLEKACELKKIRRSNFEGIVTMKSRIPVGAGLGASAALCVAVAKWFQDLRLVSENETPEFARLLENLFHGESSGVDIAVALSGKPLRFLRSENPTLLPLGWTPNFYLSYSGQRGVTLECVNQVKKLFSVNPELAAATDQRMQMAVRQCEQALKENSERGFGPLAEALELASTCFKDWGLVEGPLQTHMEWLKSQGAVAVKPTGSGKGGYVLSLWKQRPPATLNEKLIPCFSDQ